MQNKKLENLFEEIADILEILQVEWKPRAYRKAAESIASLSRSIEDIYEEKGITGLKEIPGIGEALAKKIVEFLKTGSIKEYEKLIKKIPKSVEEMVHLQGLGPKKTYRLFKELNIKSIAQLEKACKQGKLRKLEGFGEKSEKEILTGIQYYKKGLERKSIGLVLPVAKEIVEELKKLKEVEKIEIVGSLRRMKETIKDIDLLVVSKNRKKVMEKFTTLPNVEKIISKGETRSSVVLSEGLNCDLRVVPEKSFGAAMQYFTGSKQHSVEVRKIAIKKGYKLNEYGLFKGKRYLCGRTEKEIYKKLGLPYFPPELRENRGELSLKKIPNLISLKDIKGDLHVHTLWSDGIETTENMILACRAKKYEYVAITDHSKSQSVANGLSEKRLIKHIEEIENLKNKIKGIKILIGSEVDILKDGSLDYSNKILKKLDWVNISLHSYFKQSPKEATKRVLKALDNPYVTVFSHPTARSIGKRGPINFDIEKVIQKAVDNKILLEINSAPKRLDLKDVHAKLVVEMGAKVIINTDSHRIEHLDNMLYGVATARRGWVEKKHVVNALSWNKFKKYIK